MNRIVILHSGLLGRLPSRRPSSTRRAGFYAADMSGKIILQVIWAGAASIADGLTSQGPETGHHAAVAATPSSAGPTSGAFPDLS
jgi:hypothetical protein